jgi:hypothetical protein
MKRLLAVYNICGIGGFQNYIYYENAIESLLRQKGFAEGELKIVVSSCCSNDDTVRNLTNHYQGLVSFNWIGDSVPLTVSFNHTVMKAVEHLGEFDGYLYLDSGINLWDPSLRFDALKTLWDVHLSTSPAGNDWSDGLECHKAITAAMPSNDDGSSWWGITYPEYGEYVYQIGQTTNLHCQIYSEEFRKAYNGKLHCDIFANDTSESVTSYLCAAIERKFVMTNRIRVFHNAHLDGASIGWRGGDGPRKRLFMTEKSMDERYAEGHKYGFGYEECNGNQNWVHDKDMFDEYGNAKDPEGLHNFLKNELFLKKEEFDYDSIAHHFEV